MTAPVPRDYQHDLIRDTRLALRSFRSVIMQAPTGSGKSVIIAYMIARALEKGNSTWLICHRKELLEQLSVTLFDAGVPHGVIMAGRSMTSELVQVASIQTLVRRLGQVRPPKMLAIDECHHATAATYRKVIDHCPDSWNLGLTATPVRGNGRGLGDVYQAIVPGPSVADLIARGYLSKFRIIAPAHAVDVSGVHTRGGDYVRDELAAVVDRTGTIGDAVAHYRTHVAPGTCLVYCVSRRHARHVTDAYRGAGIDARYVAADIPKDEREAIVAGFRQGSPKVMVSVDLFGEGLDCPGLNAVQLLRPTQSLVLHLQQIGRGLRVEAGKESCVILDHVGNTWRHGLPDDDREWTLDPVRKRKSKAEEEEAMPALRHCAECFAIFRASLQECPDCGATYKINGKVPDAEDGELHEIDPERHRIMRKREEGMADGLEGLTALAVKRGYKLGWAARRHHYRSGVAMNKALNEERAVRRSLGAM